MMAAMNQQQLRGEMQSNVSMAGLCSWRAGGFIDHLYRPADVDDLSLFLQQTAIDEPLLWLGLGSNLLVRDGGFHGTAIAQLKALSKFDYLDDDLLRVEAGVTCSKVARSSARNGMGGLSFLAGIPGTVGGALAMNAGAFEGETWDFVAWVETIDRQGVVHKRQPEEFDVSYRHVRGMDNEWFVAAIFRMQAEDTDLAKTKIQQLLQKRAESQPTKQASCGSVFRNPKGDFAARLIERCGLKGKRIGDAEVSQKHANFIVNKGKATASDIEQLILLVQQQVQLQQGVLLQPEVHIVGDAI